MTLEYNAQTGEHSFIPPKNPYIGQQDALGRTAAPGSPVTEPIGPADFSQPQVVKGHHMDGYEVVSFQVELYDARGTWQQAGTIDKSHANFASNEMVCDAPNVMRHPFKVNLEELVAGDYIIGANTATIFFRMIEAYFAGKQFFTMGTIGTATLGDPVMWGETSATNPEPAEVTTYAPNSGSEGPLCMAVVTTAGVARLWIGYFAASGAATGVEAFAATTLASPTQVDVSNGHTGAATQVSGIIQAPNGDIQIATAAGDLRLCTNNTAALAALSFTTMQPEALGLFPVAVGPCALANYSPGALWLCTDDVASTSAGWNNVGEIAVRGRLVLASYDGLTLDPIDFPDLPYVSRATIYRGGVLACDTKSHFWYTGKDMISTDGGNDRPVDSHKHRICAGHGVHDDRYFRIECEVDDRFVGSAPNADYNTVARVIEYDPYRKRERPLSKDVDLGWGDYSFVVGAQPSFPTSPDTNNLHWFSTFDDAAMDAGSTTRDYGHFWRQYQPDSNTQGFSARSTDSDTAGGPVGFEGFDDDPVYRTPQLRHPALKGFEYTPIRVILPAVENLEQGGDDASIDVAILDSDGTTLYSGTASGGEPAERYPTIPLGDWPNRTWATSFQAEVTSHLGTGVTHKTTQVFPLTFEVVARRPLPRGVKL